MKYRTLIATGIVATAGLGLAGGALAAPEVSAVEVTKTGKTKVEVDVATLRGTSAAQPRITVTVKRRIARAKVTDWDAGLLPDDVVQSTAKLKRVRAAVGSTVTVRVRACDDTCATTTHSVTVAADDNSDGTDPAAPLAPGAIDAAGATAVALQFVGTGSSLIGVERADEYGAAWEVKVLRADGARVKVYVNADGSVASSRVEAPEKSGERRDDRPAPAPLPDGSVSGEKAAEIAVAAVGAGSTVREVERKYREGVAWEVKVVRADGVRFEVKIAADGTVLRVEQDD